MTKLQAIDKLLRHFRRLKREGKGDEFDWWRYPDFANDPCGCIAHHAERLGMFDPQFSRSLSDAESRLNMLMGVKCFGPMIAAESIGRGDMYRGNIDGVIEFLTDLRAKYNKTKRVKI